MKYLFFNSLIGFGGLEMQVCHRAKDAENRGEFSIIAALPNSRTLEYCKSLNLNTIELETKSKYFDFAALKKLASLVNEYNIDCIIVGKSDLLFLAILLKKFYVKNCTVFFYQQMQSGIMKKDLIHNFIYQNLDAAIVLTELMKKELCSSTKINPKRVNVVPYGIEESRFNLNISKTEAREKFNLPNDKFIIGCIGRIEKQKDQSSLVEAFIQAKVSNKFLVICGGIDEKEYYDNLISRIEAHNLQSSFQYIPFTNDVPSLMHSFDLFILPSLSETFGLVYAEAMFSGLPVAGVNSGGVPEIIEVNKSGFLFEQREILRIKEIIEYFAANPEKAIEFGEYGRKQAQARYNYKIQTDKFFKICGEKVESRDKRAKKL